MDPRNRWSLYRGRLSVWLDGRPEVLAQRLRRSPHVRPLVTGRDPIGTLRDLAMRRERFYAAASLRLSGVTEVMGVVEAIEARLAAPTALEATTLLRAATPIGRLLIGRRHRGRRRGRGASPAGGASRGPGLGARGMGGRRRVARRRPGRRRAGT